MVASNRRNTWGLLSNERETQEGQAQPMVLKTVDHNRTVQIGFRSVYGGVYPGALDMKFEMRTSHVSDGGPTWMWLNA